MDLESSTVVIGVPELKEAFDGIFTEYKEILIGENKELFKKCIKQINDPASSKIVSRSELTPEPGLLFNAFKVCPPQKMSVVIIGQDPYPTRDDAHGLSFSAPRRRTIPASLRNIYAALVASKQIDKTPTHGCLENWAKQGVLLLNMALTTKIRAPNTHQFWIEYTNALISTLTKKFQGLIFLLWGANAKQAEKYITKGKNHIILTWGHPSPMSTVNGNPANRAAFANCDHFKKVNEILSARGQQPINWDPDYEPLRDVVQQDNTIKYVIYLGTDGGATANGKINCRASWSFVVRAGTIPTNITQEELAMDFSENFILTMTYDGSGIVDEKNVPGEEYTASNNMGELTSILKGLTYILDNNIQGDINIVSDSLYSLNSVDVWAREWLKNPKKHKLEKKKNLHLIIPIKDLIDNLRKTRKVILTHVRGHCKPPSDTLSIEWFIWSLNDQADKLCQEALKD